MKNSRTQSRKMLFLKIFGIIFTLILIFVFIIPFIFGKSTSNASMSEYLDEYDRIAEKSTISDKSNEVSITSSKEFIDKISELKVQKEKLNEYKTEWNETPLDRISESDIFSYKISLIGKNGENITEKNIMKIEIKKPENLNFEKIKVFSFLNNSYIKDKFETKTDTIILYKKSLNTLILTDDKNNAEQERIMSVDAVSLKYENILSLSVFGKIFTENNENVKLLVFFKEKDGFDKSKADSICENENGKFIVKNISFADIDKTVYLRFYLRNGFREYYGDVLQYDILQYCINGYNNTEDNNLKQLFLGTVCYSQMSNDYVDANVNIFNKFALATNYNVSLADTIGSSTVNSKNVFSVKGENPFFGRNVDMNNKIVYNVYLNPKYEKDVKNLKVKLTLNGNEYMLDFAMDDAYGYYKASFEGIQPYDINSVFTLVLLKGDKQIGGVVSDSIGTFIGQGKNEYKLEKDRKMFSASVFFMNACDAVFKR